MSPFFTVRHALPASYVGTNKALALAHYLRGLHPTSTIEPHPNSVPESIIEGDASWKAMTAADVLLDCTTDDAAFRWLSAFGKRNGKTVIALHINAGASMLTISCSGKHISCSGVARKLYADIRAGEASFTQADYDPDIPEVEIGAGCWAGTFPGRGDAIAALVASAMPYVNSIIAKGRRSHGVAYVLRRNDVSDTPGPIVELVFSRDYR